MYGLQAWKAFEVRAIECEQIIDPVDIKHCR